MPSPTTHVIEIESGIGEPAFIPLTLGQELQPISVGKKGMWRVESARVLDVHAFVYFDGASLFLQSADEGSAATVDGYRVGKAWTELHAPCQIEIGGARLRFRSLAGDAEQQATMAMANAPVHGVPGGSAAPTRRDPDTLPKSERPFKPGEFASRPDDDSTRVAPLESTGAQRVQIGGSVPPLPAAGRPIEEDDLHTRAAVPRATGSSRALAPPGATGPFPAAGVQSLGALPMPSYPPPMGSQPQMMMGPQGPMMQGGPGQMQMPVPPGSYPQQPGYPMSGGSGAYAAAPMGGMPMGSVPPGQMYPGQMPMGMPMGSMPPGQMPMGMQMGMGALPPQAQPSGPIEEYVAKYRELSPPKKILVFIAPLCLIAAFYVLLVDDDPPPQARRSIPTDAGVLEGGAAAKTTAPLVAPPVVPPSAPLAAACPPGFEPYPGGTQGGGAVPCVPIGSVAGGTATAATTDAGGGGHAHKEKDAGTGSKDAGAHSPTLAAGQKTLERQAVDYVAQGEYVKALGVYEQLRAQNPNNAAYGEAVRILKAKVASPGAP